MHPRQALLLSTALLLASAGAAACNGGNGSAPDPRCDPGVSSYQGEATDETCIVLLDAELNGAVQVGGPNVSVFTTPTNGQAISSSALTVTFRWTSPIDADGDAALLPHEPPITGAVHMVRIRADGDERLFFTTRLHVDIGGPDLAAIKAAGDPLTAQITSVYVTQNRILTPASDGPFRPAADTSFGFTP